jgi:hypothetical protein
VTITRRLRIGLKLAVAGLLILVLVLYAREGVDFVYTGF